MTKAKANAKEVEKKVQETEVAVVAPKTLEEQKHEIDNLISDWNAASKAGDAKELAKLQEDLKTAIEGYNKSLRVQEYDKFLASEAPVYAALKQCKIDQVAQKNKAVEEGEPKQIALNEDKWAIVNLIEFNEYAKEVKAPNLFISGQWVHNIDQWRIALTAFNAGEIEDANGKTAMRKLFKEGDVDFSGTISKNKLKETAQIILDQILVNPDADAKPFIFEGKDVAYVKNHAFKASNKKALGSTAPRYDTIVALFTRALHRIVTNGNYETEFKEKK